jgi:hypothetical protein
VSQETTNRSFDELASGLASGSISRGRALRLMGAALLGGALSFTPKVAEAAITRHQCDRAGECRNGSCCGRTDTTRGTCCGGGGTGVSCFPAAAACGTRVQTLCATTTEGETTCLAACFLNVPCNSTADCVSGSVCAVFPSGNSCVSRCKGGSK